MSSNSNYIVRSSVALKMAKYSIKPFKEGGDDETGFKKYGMVIHDGTNHRATPFCRVDGSIKTYITGMNEDAPEVQNLSQEVKEARIKVIRQLVAKAEREISGNYELDPNAKDLHKDVDFWKKVKTFKSVVPDTFTNKGVRQLTYWDTMELTLDNDGRVLDENNIKDLILISVIEAGGFPSIALSYKDAMENSRSTKIKFYLDVQTSTAEIKTSEKRVRDKAGAKLLAIYEGDANKLFYITKLLSNQSASIKMGKNATPIDIMYEECSDYIDANVPDVTSKEEGSKKFLELTDMKLSELIARAVIKDSFIYGKLFYKEQHLMHKFTQTILGSNVEDAVQYLLAPANSKMFDQMKEEVTNEWSK